MRISDWSSDVCSSDLDDFQAGLFPKLGNHFIRTISVRSYPTSTRPGMLDLLNSLGVSYRWVCRYLPLDKEDARKEVETTRKRWFAKRKGIGAMIKRSEEHTSELQSLMRI